MLKLLARTAFILLALSLALFVPSAPASKPSHRATFHASHGVRHVRRHARHGKRHAHKRSRAPKLALLDASKSVSTVNAPLLGDATIESQVDFLGAGQAEMFRFQASASNVTGVAHVYLDSRNGARTLTVGLYAAGSTGQPGALLGAGVSSSLQGGAWVSLPLTGVSLSSGKYYWLAVLGAHGTLRFRDRRNGPCQSLTSWQTNLTTLPSTWRTGHSYSDCPVSAYLTPPEEAVAPPPASEPIEPPSEPIVTPPTANEPIVTAPANTAPPTISGSAVEGQLLSASEGSWSGSPTAMAFQWQDCDSSGANCADIAGANSSNHQLTSGEVGHTVRVLVTASNAGGSASAASPITAPVAALSPVAPVNVSSPAISGSTMLGQTLSGSNGSWTGSPTGYGYQWQRCSGTGASCSSLQGATSSRYTLGSADVGHAMRVIVTAENAGGATAATSASEGPVGAPAPTAAFAFEPASPTSGQVVHFDGTASTCADAPCSYEWSDDGSPIQPATTLWPLGSGERLDFTFSEAGTKYVRLSVTDAAGQTASVEHNVQVGSSAPSAPANTSVPAISGSAVEGQVLSASVGSWSGSPTSYGFQWQDCDSAGANCVNIAGATSSSYTLVGADVGHTIRVVVTATNAGGSTAASSSATAPVTALVKPPAPPANTSVPAISGSAVEGQVLSASVGSWSGSPTSYGFQWQDCDSAGANCVNIASATSSSYTLVGADVGHTIRVTVTARNEGGSASASSAQTSAVSAPSSGGSCTTTVSSTSQINGALKAGAVVCLAAGTYGAVSITTTPSSNATLTAAPGAHVVVGGVNIAASNITVSQLHSTGTINVGAGAPYPGFNHDVIEHNEVGPTNGYGISVMSATSTPSSYITIAGNKIHDTSSTGEGDALRFDGWNHITVSGNDIYNIKDCAGSGCHTDTLQSYNGGVSTTGLTVTKNYTHDNVGAQGLPFLKDGDISNVQISDNLSVRNSNTNGQVTGVWVDENIVGLSITNNTYQSTSGSIVQSDGSASGPTVAINHNVFDNINVRTGSGPAYATTEDYDVFTGNDEYTFGLGAHSLLTSKPTFVNTSTDDYRLASNPNKIGIDWSPAEQQYGPSS